MLAQQVVEALELIGLGGRQRRFLCLHLQLRQLRIDRDGSGIGGSTLMTPI